MTEQEQAYWQASKLSFANLEGSITIPANRLDEIVEITLPFQPLGISSVPLSGGGDRVCITHYYAPAVALAYVIRDESGLHFEMDWMRGALSGIVSYRGGFPDIAPSVGANRCYTANLDERGYLWVARGDREFFVLRPPEDRSKKFPDPLSRWHLVERVTLPKAEPEYRDVHSVLMNDTGRMWTVEANGKCDEWAIYRYGRSLVGGVYAGGYVATVPPISTMPWRYGLALSESMGLIEAVTVTGFLTTKEPGIYSGNTLLVPGVYGTGIAPLYDGGALVSRYGEHHKSAWGGVPGALIYVPPKYFKAFRWFR